MPYQLQAFAIEPADEDHAPLEGLVRLSDRCHYRVRTIQPAAVGQFEFCGLGDGFFLLFGEIDAATRSSERFSAPDMLQLRIASDGEGEYVSADGEQLRFSCPSATIILEPAGQSCAKASATGYNRFVHLLVHRNVLKTLYGGNEHELPALLQRFLDGRMQRTVAGNLPLNAALLRCQEDLHACTLEGRRRRLYLQAKAVEILCQAFEVLEREDGFGSVEASLQTARSVLKAQRVLSENFAAPPSLGDLAHAVGLSRSGLCAGFREILGQSVFDYIQDLRMQRALAMLNQRNDSITQIAYAVGYNHASSFSVAVQRHFGASPRELRRRSALPAN